LRHYCHSRRPSDNSRVLREYRSLAGNRTEGDHSQISSLTTATPPTPDATKLFEIHIQSDKADSDNLFTIVEDETWKEELEFVAPPPMLREPETFVDTTTSSISLEATTSWTGSEIREFDASTEVRTTLTTTSEIETPSPLSEITEQPEADPVTSHTSSAEPQSTPVPTNENSEEELVWQRVGNEPTDEEIKNGDRGVWIDNMQVGIPELEAVINTQMEEHLEIMNGGQQYLSL